MFTQCRIDYELALSNRHAMVLKYYLKYYLMLGGKESRPKGDAFESEAFQARQEVPRRKWDFIIRYMSLCYMLADVIRPQSIPSAVFLIIG